MSLGESAHPPNMSAVDAISRTQAPSQSLERTLETNVAAEALATLRETAGDAAKRDQRERKKIPPPTVTESERETAEQINLPDSTGTRLNVRA